MNYIYKYLLIVIAPTIGILLIFNLITPLICNYMPNQFAKAEMVQDSLQNKNFQPEILAFGSSLVQTGVNGYVLRKELGNSNIYNLATPSQDLKSTCGYLPMLPTSVKTIILGVRIDDFSTANGDIKSSSIQDSLFQSYLKAKIEAPKQFFLIENYKNRACLKAGLQVLVTDFIDNDAPGEESLNIIYPYLYPNNRTVTTYERDVERRNKEGDVIVEGRIINTDFVELLKRTNEYLQLKGIHLFVYLIPSSPDINFSKKGNTKLFISEIENNLPKNLDYINCFDSLEADDFYDSVHPNRIGADKLSKILSKHILKQQKNAEK